MIGNFAHGDGRSLKGLLGGGASFRSAAGLGRLSEGTRRDESGKGARGGVEEEDEAPIRLSESKCAGRESGGHRGAAGGRSAGKRSRGRRSFAALALGAAVTVACAAAVTQAQTAPDPENFWIETEDDLFTLHWTADARYAVDVEWWHTGVSPTTTRIPLADVTDEGGGAYSAKVTGARFGINPSSVSWVAVKMALCPPSPGVCSGNVPGSHAYYYTGMHTAPENLTTVVSSDSANLIWDVSGPGNVAFYEVRFAPGTTVPPDTPWSRISGSASWSTSHLLGGLRNGLQYSAQIRYGYGHVRSQPSNTVTFTPNSLEGAAPDAPSVWLVYGDGFVTVHWAPNGRQHVRNWQVRYVRLGDGSPWTHPLTVPGGSRARSHTFHVSSGYAYRFVVWGTNSAGTGLSAQSHIAFVGPPPSVEVVAEDEKLSLSWPDPGYAEITKYGVQVDNGYWSTITPTASNGRFTHEIPSLANDRRYRVRIQPRTFVAFGPWAEVYGTPTAPVAQGAPSRPTGFEAQPRDGAILLVWDSMADATGWEYRQQLSASTWGSWTTVAGVGASTSSVEVGQLTNGTAYRFQVRATNASGTGPASAERVAVPRAPSVRPSAPNRLWTIAQNGQVELLWDGLADVQKWQYQQRAGGGAYGGWIDVPRSAARDENEDGYLVTGLQNGITYGFRIRAVNSAGVGTASAEAVGRPVAPPGVPSNFRAFGSNRQLALFWDPSPDVDLVQYSYVEQNGSYTSGGWVSIPDSGYEGVNRGGFLVQTSRTISDLDVKLRAVNGSGIGVSTTNVRAASQAPAPPTKPSGFSAIGADSSVALSWTEQSAATKWQYRQKSGTQSFGDWQDVPTSAYGESHDGSYTVTGLTNGTAYTFELRAVSPAGAGNESDEAIATPAAADLVPMLSGMGAPDIPTLTVDYLSEALPSAVGADGALTYKLELLDGSALPAGVSFDAAARTFAVDVSALTGTLPLTYSLRYFAIDDDGTADTADDDESAAVEFAIRISSDLGPAFATGASVVSVVATQYEPISPVTPPAVAMAGNGATSYALTPALPDGLVFDPTTRILSGTPTTALPPTTYAYSASDSDNHLAAGDEASLTFTIAVDGVPSFGNSTIRDQVLVEDTPIRVLTLPEAIGGDGGVTYALTPALPSGLSFDPASRQASGTPTSPQAATSYVYTATDGDGSQATITFQVSVEERDRSPTFLGAQVPDQVWAQDATLIDGFALPAASSGNGNLAYSLTPALPTGLQFDYPSLTITGTPSTAQAATQYSLTATDLDGDTSTLVFTIAVLAENRFPDFGGAGLGDQYWTVGMPVTPLVLPEATGGNGWLRYSIAPELPAGVTFDPVTRSIQGAPSATHAYAQYSYTAVDADGDESTILLRIAVAPPPVERAVPLAPWTEVLPGDGQLVINWGPSAGSPYVDSWTLSVWGPSYYFTQSYQGGDHSRSVTVGGLTNGGGYSFQLQGRNSLGLGSRTSWEYVTVGAAPNVDVIAGDGTLRLSWPDLGYTVTAWDLWVDDSLARITPTESAGSFSYTVSSHGKYSSLFNDKRYRLALYPIVTYGYAVAPAILYGTPTASPPSGAPARPSGFAAEGRDRAVYLSWNAISTATSWEYRQGTGDSRHWAAWQSVPDSGPSTTSVLIGDLVNGTEYRFQVRAGNATGKGEETGERTATPLPQAAPSPKLSALGRNGLVELRWLPVPNALKWQYRQRSGAGAFGPWIDVPDSADGGPNEVGHDVSGLTNGISYGFQVRPVSSDRTGSESNEAVAMPIGLPAAPTNFLAVAGDAEVLLHWDPIPEAQAFRSRWGVFDGYRTSFGSWYNIPNSATGEANERSYRVAGLENRKTYCFELRAINLAGRGATSAVCNRPDTGAPGNPIGVSVSPGNAAVRLDWAVMPGVQMWQYQYKAAGQDYGGWTDVLDSAPGETNSDGTDVGGLTNGTAYTFRVRAVNAAGEGNPSQEVSATPVRPDSAPAFLATIVPPLPRITVDLVSNPLPVATGGDGGISYVLERSDGSSLPAGMNFESSARTLSVDVSAVTDILPKTYALRYVAVDDDGTIDIADDDKSVPIEFNVSVNRDRKPAFAATASVSSVVATQGTPISPVSLPAVRVSGNGTPTYSLQPALPAGLEFDADARRLSGTATAQFPATTYTYRAADEDNHTATADTAELTFTVEVNAVPSFGGATVPDRVWVTNASVRALELPAAVDGSGEPTYTLTPALPSGLSFDAATRRISGTPTAAAATAVYTLTATYPDSSQATLSFQITVEDTDRTPSFGSEEVQDQHWTQGMTVVGGLSLPNATGGNGELIYSLTPELAAGLTFDPSGPRIIGTPSVVKAKTEYTLSATDADGDTATLAFSIEVAVSDRHPSFGSASVADQTWTQHAPITDLVLPAATNTGNGVPRYALTPDLPAGVTFDAQTRTISGTPASALATTYFSLTVTDADGDEASISFRISVDALPTFGGASVAPRVWTRNRSIRTLTLPAAQGGNGNLTYSIQPVLPAGTTFDASSRQISGRPYVTKAETTYTLTATDEDGDTATLAFQIAVDTTSRIPGFGSESVDEQTWTQNSEISDLQLPMATGGSGEYVYSLSPELPAGLVFSPDTRRITGTPSAIQARTAYSLTATDDDFETATLTFYVTVESDPPPTLVAIERLDPTASPTNADVVSWRLTFSEVVRNVTGGDFSVSNAGAVSVTVYEGIRNGSLSHRVYDVEASGGNLDNLDGTVTLGIASTQDIVDAFGNALSITGTPAVNENTYELDNTAPTVASVARQTPSSSPTAADEVTWRVTFSEAVRNVDDSDFLVSGTGIGDVAVAAARVTDTIYDVKASGGNLADLDDTISLAPAPSQNVADPAGNTLSTDGTPSPNDVSYELDNTAPTISKIERHDPTGSPTNEDELTWLITFSESVRNVDGADFGVTGPGAGEVAVSAVKSESSDAVWEVSASGGNLAGLDATVTLALSDSPSVADLAGNALSTTAVPSPNDVSYELDNTAPTISKIERHDPTGSPTNEDELTWLITFSESVRNVDGADFGVTGPGAGEVAVSAVKSESSDAVWEVSASGGNLAGLDATVTLALSDSPSVADFAGNALSTTAVPSPNDVSYELDNTAPTISKIERHDPTGSPTNEDELTWLITFSESVRNVDGADFGVTGPGAGQVAVSAVKSESSDAVWEVSASGGNLAGLNATVTLALSDSPSVADLAGNALSTTAVPSPNDVSYELDNTAPTISKIERHDPTGSPTNEDELTWLITFSESVRNVDGADFGVTGPGAGQVAVSAVKSESSDAVWEVSASGGNLAGLDATVTLALSDSPSVADLAGNALSTTAVPSPNDVSYELDNTAPTISKIERHDPTGSPTNEDELTWLITFSESVRNVDGADFGVTGPGAGQVAVSAVKSESSDAVWEVSASEPGRPERDRHPRAFGLS